MSCHWKVLCTAVRRPRRVAADNLWAPPTFVDRRAAVDTLSARRRCHCCCVVILLQFSMTEKRPSEKFADRTKFFRESLKKIHLAAHAAPQPIFWTGGAPPPTQIDRRRPAAPPPHAPRSS